MRDSDFYDHYENAYWDEEPEEMAFQRWFDEGLDSKEEIGEAVDYFFNGPTYLIEAVLERERLTPGQCDAIFSSWPANSSFEGRYLGYKLALIWKNIRDPDDDFDYSPETFNQLAIRASEHDEPEILEALIRDPRADFTSIEWQDLFEEAGNWSDTDVTWFREVKASIPMAAWTDEPSLKEILFNSQGHENNSSWWGSLIEKVRSKQEMGLNMLLCKHIGIGAREFSINDLIDFASLAATVGNLDALRLVLLHCIWFQPHNWSDLIDVCMKILRRQPEVRATFLMIIQAVSGISPTEILNLSVKGMSVDTYEGGVSLAEGDPEWKIDWQSVLRTIASMRNIEARPRFLSLHFRTALRLGYHPTIENYIEAMECAIDSKNAAAITLVHHVLRQRERNIPNETWGRLANMARNSKVGEPVAQALWEATGSSVVNFDDNTLRSFKALGESCVTTPAYVRTLVERFHKNTTTHTKPTKSPQFTKDTEDLNRILTAIRSNNPAIVSTVLRESSKSSKFWSKVSAEFKEMVEDSPEQAGNPIKREICNILFAFWEPEPNAFVDERAIWINLLISADLLNDEVMIHKIALRLLWLYDPTRYPDLGEVHRVLWRLRNRMSNETLGDEIEHLLHGNHWDVAVFFRALQAWPPRSVRDADTRFGGAARCLNKWIINRYFAEDTSGFDSDLRRWVRGFQGLPATIRQEAWLTVLSSGWENVGGNILGRCRKLFSNHFDNYICLGKEEFLKKAADGSITRSIAELLEEYSRFSPVPSHSQFTRYPKAEYNSLVRRMNPLVERVRATVLSASKEAQDKETNRRLRKTAVESCQPEMLDEDEAMQFMMILLNDIADAKRPEVVQYASNQIHDMKHEFEKRISKPLRATDLTYAERETLYWAGRHRLESPVQIIESRRRAEETTQDVNLNKVIQRFQSILERSGLKIEYIQRDDLKVAGFHGARQQLEERIFEEISRNILNAIKVGTVRISVNARSGTLVVVEIENPTGNGVKNRFSTRLGLQTLRDRMDQFRKGTLCGDAEFEKRESSFITRLTFPR